MVRKPSWGLLTGLVLAVIAATVSAPFLSLPPFVVRVVPIAGTVLVPALVMGWLRANRTALLVEEAAKAGPYRMTTYEYGHLVLPAEGQSWPSWPAGSAADRYSDLEAGALP